MVVSGTKGLTPVDVGIRNNKLRPVFEGWKRYEISNHLGNVLAVVTDRKRGRSTTGTAIQWFEADVVSTQQYYPFGMLMPGNASTSLRRQYSLGGYDYRYGFNGKEGDDEVKGDDNQQDYGMRISDPRVGRFLSVDPITAEYPMLTPYQFASNTPIQAVDLDGKEAFIVHGTTQTETGVHITPEAKKELMRITGNTKVDDKFRWNAPIYNNSFLRNISANQLVKHIVKTRMAMIENGKITEDEAISLIGYSHGGNVSIQAARKLGKMGIKVNLVTLSTPVYNTSGNDAYGGGLDSEDPRAASDGINAHYQIVHEKDDVVDIAGGDEEYNNGKTKNYVITNDQIPYNNGIEAHTKFPSDEKLDDVLKDIPSMPKFPAPKLPATGGN